MAEARIPVDIFNPGQVFACLGFLEAADILIGDAAGGFDWGDESDVRFTLRTPGNDNPVETVLNFFATTRLSQLVPIGYKDPPPKEGKEDAEKDGDENTNGATAQVGDMTLLIECCFPSASGDRMALPVRLESNGAPAVDMGHWADGSSRETFKLYAGNRSADLIVRAMLWGTKKKPTKKHPAGSILTKGIAQLWESIRAELVAHPFDSLTPMGGSFNFDPRGVWTAIHAGYSPNDQKHDVAASPVVEILAALGLENARPDEFATRKVRYAVWGIELPPLLARAALTGAIPSIPSKHFRFDLDLSGKNKGVTFATLEKAP